MKDQVTSIEQSKRLIDLEVPAEKASMVWRRMFIGKTTGFSEWALKIGPVKKYTKSEVFEILPAFTVADLMGLIKPSIFTTNELDPCLEKITENGEWAFEFGQISEDEDFGYARNGSLIDLLVGRIEWILYKGYKLNL